MTEKSIIIGKGGWVVGKLREKLGFKSIHVISYTDIILKEYQLELSVKHVHNLLNEDKIPLNYIDAFTNLYTLLKQKQEAPYNTTIIEKYIDDNTSMGTPFVITMRELANYLIGKSGS